MLLPATSRLWGPQQSCGELRSTLWQLRSSSQQKSEALASAPLDNAPKEYPPKIQQLVQDIASLTILENTEDPGCRPYANGCHDAWCRPRCSCSP
ncbi:hypothetical protein STEG23_000734 [Scotinomys teguina]